MYCNNKKVSYCEKVRIDFEDKTKAEKPTLKMTENKSLATQVSWYF